MCCCWRSPAQFPAKHQKASCAFYRVCLTCKETKTCGLCGKHLQEKNFSKAQWQRTRNKARMCTACQQHGNWTCSVCKTRRLLSHFSLWRKKHRGQHGKQKCNICIHMKHAKQQTHARLKRRRRKITEAKVARVLQEVHTEIQQIKRKQRAGSEGSAKSQQTIEASPTEHKKARIQMHKPHAQIQAQDTEIPRVNEKQCSHGQNYRAPSAGSTKKPSDKLLEYECPYCHVTIYSTVESGNVKATGHCVASSFESEPQMWPADSIR